METLQAQREKALKEMTDTTYKAINKSDDYLLRHFFAEFVTICQEFYFPSLLINLDL